MDYLKGYFELTNINNRNCSLRKGEEEKKNFMKNLNKTCINMCVCVCVCVCIHIHIK